MSLLRTKLIHANNTRAFPAVRYRLQQHNSLQQTSEKRVGIQPLRYAMVTKKFLPEKTSPKNSGKVIREEKPTNDAPSHKVVKKRIKPDKAVWLIGHGAIERIDKKTGDIYHLKQQAAVYQNVNVTQKIITPPEYRIVRVKKALKFTENKPEELVPYEVIQSKPERNVESPQKVIKQKSNLILLTQIKLKKILFYKHKVDGIFGTNTKAALSMFQRKNKLPVGQLDGETLEYLGVLA